ncbi:MAG: MerR family transcriptional regulator [bacterium]
MKELTAFYNISTAAEKLGISVRMLREYEKDGLIKPYRNPSNGYRVFSNDDIQWIRCVRDLIHQQGLNIKGIQRLLMVMPCWEIKNCPEETRRKCTAVVDRTVPCWTLANGSCANANKCRTCKVYLEAQKNIK